MPCLPSGVKTNGSRALLFAICHLSSDIYHLPFAIQHHGTSHLENNHESHAIGLPSMPPGGFARHDLRFGRVVAGDELRLSSLDLGAASQGYGNPAADKTVDGHPLTLGGKIFEHGFGTHADSRLVLDAQRFGPAVYCLGWC